MDRLTLAYSLMAAMAAVFAGFIAYRMYHSRARSYRRRVARENATYAAAQQRRNAADAPPR